MPPCRHVAMSPCRRDSVLWWGGFGPAGYGAAIANIRKLNFSSGFEAQSSPSSVYCVDDYVLAFGFRILTLRQAYPAAQGGGFPMYFAS